MLPSPKNGQLKCETSLAQAWAADIARPEGPHAGDHERESAQKEPCAQRTRNDEAGDAVPGSQDSITR